MIYQVSRKEQKWLYTPVLDETVKTVEILSPRKLEGKELDRIMAEGFQIGKKKAVIEIGGTEVEFTNNNDSWEEDDQNQTD